MEIEKDVEQDDLATPGEKVEGSSLEKEETDLLKQLLRNSE